MSRTRRGRRCSVRSLLVAWSVGLGIAGIARLAEPARGDDPPGVACPVAAPRNVAAADPDGARRTAAEVDRLLAARLAAETVAPAPRADDAEFLRRLSLDLTGTIPAVGGDRGLRAFLADPDPHKDERWIEHLLATPKFAATLARLWTDELFVPGATNFAQPQQFQQALQNEFAGTAKLDGLARRLLVAKGNVGQDPLLAFYFAAQNKPEELATTTARAFLGVQLDCAQCHDHPFDRWTQHDFWSFAAYFAQLPRPVPPQTFVGRVEDLPQGDVVHPKSGATLAPRPLDGTIPAADDTGLDGPPEPDRRTRRAQLADWLVARDNPYFARAAANRAWAMLFGYGLVDPVDDFSSRNPPSHPEILELLADDFRSHGCDLRRPLRVLTRTAAYRRTSATTGRTAAADGTPEDPRLYARMPLRVLTAAQLYDSLIRAAAVRNAGPAVGGVGSAAFAQGTTRAAFTAKFSGAGRPATEFRSGIPQALTLMNGELVASLVDPARSDLILALADVPFLSAEEKVEALFLSALSRPPRSDERARFARHVDEQSRAGQEARALSDVLWTLLNTTEFGCNH